MCDSQLNSLRSSGSDGGSAACDSGANCCHGESSDHHHADLEIREQHSQESSIGGPFDGAGEPCPTPLMWQEILENYFRDSVPWEIERGPHRLTGRTWGQGTPLYFLNNFAATAEMYSLIAWLLRDEFQCVLFDTSTTDRGSAGKSKPTMDEFAADLFAIADSHGDDRICLFGAGFGAAVAIQAALDSPARVEGMILQHGFAQRRLTIFERLLASACWYSNQTLDNLPQRRRFQAVNHQPWFPPFDHSRFDFLLESTGTLPLSDLARRALAVNSFDTASRLHEINCPVMLLRSEGEGRLAADSQELLEKKIKHPRIEWMHSAGQHPTLTHPHRVAKLVRSIFQTQPANV